MMRLSSQGLTERSPSQAPHGERELFLKPRGIILGIILLSALLVLVFGVRRQDTLRSKATVGLNAPELVLHDESGKKYTLSELKGSVVFLNFWATWCPPCREEMPSIQNLYHHFREEKGFRVITVLYKDDFEKAKTFMKENHYDFPVLTDKGERAADSYGVTGVPETYIVDKKGVLKEKVIGPAEWNSPQVLSLMSTMIRE
jgi:cytochrome c biogenesis protein CcmG/thiol:disulfide interchange protein DsbE